MKTYKGLAALIAARDVLPQTGWIFVDKRVNKDSKTALLQADFHLPENDEDAFFGEDHLATLLEVGIFRHLLKLREKRLNKVTLEQYAEAVEHYLVKDDFLE